MYGLRHSIYQPNHQPNHNGFETKFIIFETIKEAQKYHREILKHYQALGYSNSDNMVSKIFPLEFGVLYNDIFSEVKND